METRQVNGPLDNAAAGAPANRIALHELQKQLEDPATVAALQGILSRLDLVEFGLVAADGMLQNAESLTDNLADGLKEAKGAIDPATFQALTRLVTMTPKLVNALERVSPLLESEALTKLGNPKLAESLARLSEHTELLEASAIAATEFLGRAEILVDNVAEGYEEVRAGLVDSGSSAIAFLAQLGRLVPTAQLVLNSIMPMVESGSIEHLISSKILAPEMIDTVAQLGDALHATQSTIKEDPKQVGLFGLLKALRDPDAQRAMGFLITFLKEFGQRLR